MTPGSVYDRQNRGGGHRATDPMTRISPHMGTVPGLNVPMSMIMNNHFNKKPPPANQRSHRHLVLIYSCFQILATFCQYLACKILENSG